MTLKITLIWEKRGDWHVVTSPDVPELIVANPDKNLVFSDIPVVMEQLAKYNMTPAEPENKK